MTQQQFIKNLGVPEGQVDVVLDTDTYNEIDDQFAVAYLLRSQDKLNIKGFCAAPFSGNHRCRDNPEEGMNKSFDELVKILRLAGGEQFLDKTYRGSTEYLVDEKTPVESEAADFMASLANQYSPERPLYIIAIGAITNVASAILKNPQMKQNTVIVWLGGNALHAEHNREFNLRQDIAAARVIFGCGVPLVQLPCRGVVSAFTTSRYELEHWLRGKNALCDYLVRNTVDEAESYATGKPWTRPVWDVTAVAYLLNQNERFMSARKLSVRLPEYDHKYAEKSEEHLYTYVFDIKRDALFEDLFRKLTK